MPVYFIQESGTGFIKIGKGYGEHRMRTMQTANPHDLILVREIPGDYKVESTLHKLFCRDRIHRRREWFRPSSSLVNFLQLNNVKMYTTINNVWKIFQVDADRNIYLKFDGETNDDVRKRIEKEYAN